VETLLIKAIARVIHNIALSLPKEGTNILCDKNILQNLEYDQIPPGADKSLARPGRKQTQKHDKDERDFNNIETRGIITFPPPPLKDKTSTLSVVFLCRNM